MHSFRLTLLSSCFHASDHCRATLYLLMLGLGLLATVGCASSTGSTGAVGYTPTPQTPAAGSSSAYAFPNFSWSAHPDAWANPAEPMEYEIEIARDAAFDSVFDRDRSGVARYVHEQALAPGSYHWRVRVLEANGTKGPWSESASFTILSADEIVTVERSDESPAEQLAAILAAVETADSLAAAGKSVRLDFSAGDYRIPSDFEGALIQFENRRNIHIEGNGARIQFATRKQGLIHGKDSERISIANFKCSYPLGSLRIQGHVAEVERETGRITVSIQPGFPDFDQSDNKEWDIFMLLDPEVRGRLKDGAANFIRASDFEKTADGSWSFILPEERRSEWEVGDRFAYNFRTGSTWFVDFEGSRFVTAFGIDTDGYGAMGYVSKEGSNFNILHCRQLFSEGRWMTGNADGVHIRGHETGPWIEGYEIRAIGDDGIALYARPASMHSTRPDGNPRAALCNARFFNLEAGNEVSFFQPTEGRILLESTVEAVREMEDGRFHVTFADAITEDVRTEGELIVMTQIWNRSKSCGDFMVRDSKFLEIRRYGTVFRSKGGVIENNVYTGCSTHAITFKNGPQWPNGLYASEIIIRENTIRESGFDWDGQPSIAFHFNGYRTGATSVGPRNLLIENNRFVDCPEPEISLSWTRDAVVRDNETARGDPVGLATSNCEGIHFQR